MEKHEKDISSLIELYALSELEQDKIPLVEEHLRNNPDARKEVEEIRRVTAMVASGGFNEPSHRLSSDTKHAVLSLMERDRQRHIIPFFRNFYRIITRPAFASAAALIAITVCLFLIFVPNKPEQPTAPNGNDSITQIGFSGTVRKNFKSYVANSADSFAVFLTQNSDDFRNSLDISKIMNEIAQAMELRENENISQNPELNTLIADIESVWREIKDFAEGKDTADFETIKNVIVEKNIIERARTYKTAN